jgi:hypothetical protein
MLRNRTGNRSFDQAVHGRYDKVGRFFIQRFYEFRGARHLTPSEEHYSKFDETFLMKSGKVVKVEVEVRCPETGHFDRIGRGWNTIHVPYRKIDHSQADVFIVANPYGNEFFLVRAAYARTFPCQSIPVRQESGFVESEPFADVVLDAKLVPKYQVEWTRTPVTWEKGKDPVIDLDVKVLDIKEIPYRDEKEEDWMNM